MRIVIDTNVFVSALVNERGTPARVVRAWRDAEFEVIYSAALRNEIEVVLGRARIRRIIERGALDVRLLLDDLREFATFVEPDFELKDSVDPDDNRVLEAAVAGRADYIVSGDAGLLALGEVQGTLIVTPAQFVALIDS